MGEQAWQWILVTCGVFAGTLARIGQWRKPDNSFDAWKAAGELASMPAIVFLTVGAIKKWAPMLDAEPAAALATAVALVGIAAVEAILLKIFNRKADSL